MIPVTVAAEPPQDWREQVFAGALLIVPRVAALAPFRAYAERLLADAFAPAAPVAAQDELEPDDFAGRVDELRTRFRGDTHARALLVPVLEHFGLDTAGTFWDRLNLRILPAGARPQHGADLALGAHRDTWSSNVYAQVNWWLPLHDVTAQRAVAFYPRHWDTPVPNNSAAWDLDRLRDERRRGVASTVPLIPSPDVTVDPSDALAIVIQPGDLLVFSGAQLHATVPNTSGVPRFSVEIRSVALDDIRSGRQAPNIDGRAPHVPWDWFRRVDDRVGLGTVLAEADAATRSEHAAGRV